MSELIKLAIADDHSIFREGLEMIVEDQEDMQVVISAKDGKILLKELENREADVVLLDHNMPGMDGLEALQTIREAYPDLKVIVLTMHHDQGLIVKYMKKGAIGYLLKGENSKTILTYLRKANTGEKVLPPYAAKAILDELNKDYSTEEEEEDPDSPPIKFTPREKEILKIIGKKDRQKLAVHFKVEVKTIDFHLKNIKKKTNCSSIPELVYWAIRNKYQNP